MILGINTAQIEHELCLVQPEGNGQQAELLFEKTWSMQRDEVDTLVPMLETALSELGLNKKDIQQILVISGPGPFTSIRTGVSMANALAEALDTELFESKLFQLLHKKAAIQSPLLAAVNAGGLDVGVQEFSQAAAQEAASKHRVGPMHALLADYLHDKYTLITELTETQSDELKSIAHERNWKQLEHHERLSLGEVLLTFPLKEWTQLVRSKGARGTVEPFYFKNPVITKSKDKWKQ